MVPTFRLQAVRCFVGMCLAVFAIGAAAQTSGQAAKDPLIGSWKSDEATVEFRANGTVVINGDEYGYRVKKGVIQVFSDEGSMAFPYELNGDTMVVEVEGREVVYRRQKGDASGTASGPARGGEGVLQALVGKWCYMSSLTGSNSYMSSRCFVLHPDGRYEYSAESSTSGSYGSTAGQSYDSGRWTATRTSITAYSDRSGKTVYPIELRNHPKTGDAMIVLDGDAYVTAYQRPPW